MTPIPPLNNVSSIRPSTRFLGTNPKLLDTGLGPKDHSLGSIVDRQIQFGLVGKGVPSERTLVPQTRAAVDLITGPLGPNVEQMLRGVLSTVDATKGVDGLAGISLSDGQDGFAANRLMTTLDMHAADLPKQATGKDWPGLLDRLHGGMRASQVKLGIQAQNMLWVDVGPLGTKAILHAARDGRTARSTAFQITTGIMAHELQHSVKRADMKELGGPINWIEEGTADVLTWEPPTRKDMSAAMGQQYRPVFMDKEGAYTGYYAGMRHLLTLAGIDPTRGPGLEQARDMLQGTDLRFVPRRMAQAIADNHDLPAGSVDTLREMIINTAGTKQQLEWPFYSQVQDQLINHNLKHIDKFVKSGGQVAAPS